MRGWGVEGGSAHRWEKFLIRAGNRMKGRSNGRPGEIQQVSRKKEEGGIIRLRSPALEDLLTTHQGFDFEFWKMHTYIIHMSITTLVRLNGNVSANQKLE